MAVLLVVWRCWRPTLRGVGGWVLLVVIRQSINQAGKIKQERVVCLRRATRLAGGFVGRDWWVVGWDGGCAVGGVAVLATNVAS